MGYCLNKNCTNFNIYLAGSKPYSYSIVVCKRCKRCNEPLGMNNYEESLENQKLEKIEEKPKYKIMDFEEMSNNGLIWKINKEILHPLGLALARDGDTSPGCMIAPDGKWEFSEESNIRNSERFQKFKKTLEEIND